MKTILIVDDSTTMRRMIRATLQTLENISFKEAENGLEAIECLTLNSIAWIKANGGTVLTESKETCVIYGMPRAVDEIGLSDKRVPLYQMAAVIKDLN
ncbi:MAG: hypothetical protein OMM_08817 [Candidatus Magnetoglobus multicellularis str. Araruama]|uniref:protein-glutamate methylesterase n=1 Tax=Candidatus Magnetoglobus multicellularis str. Araruama TaxID=890399 RepID=A0A1V1P6B2_9BACT|nr:MAG: hypothetical protein OMM_08817 [Candidatus Magnetoglobus multicellularis str. Araruama]